MKRKTKEELKDAYTRLCELSKRKDCNSVRDLMRLSNQSICQIRTILRSAEINVTPLQFLQEQKPNTKTTCSYFTKCKEKYIVFDASVCGSEKFELLLCNLIFEGMKIILTDLTLREIKKLTKLENESGSNARYLLSFAARNSSDFILIPINQEHSNPDDNLLVFCQEHKESITLYSTDNEMCLQARIRGINVQSLKPYYQIVRTDLVKHEDYDYVLRKPFRYERIQILDNMWHIKSSTLVNKGDIILHARIDWECVHFWAYQVVRLGKYIEFYKLYSGRFFDQVQLNFVDEQYRSFISSCLANLY